MKLNRRWFLKAFAASPAAVAAASTDPKFPKGLIKDDPLPWHESFIKAEADPVMAEASKAAMPMMYSITCSMPTYSRAAMMSFSAAPMGDRYFGPVSLPYNDEDDEE